MDDVDVADGFKGIVHTSIGDADQHLLDWCCIVTRVDAFGRFKRLSDEGRSDVTEGISSEDKCLDFGQVLTMKTARNCSIQDSV